MTCDKCGHPSCGPRCPMCVRTFGDSPLVGQGMERVTRIEGPTSADRIQDSRYGWESEA